MYLNKSERNALSVSTARCQLAGPSAARGARTACVAHGAVDCYAKGDAATSCRMQEQCIGHRLNKEEKAILQEVRAAPDSR